VASAPAAWADRAVHAAEGTRAGVGVDRAIATGVARRPGLPPRALARLRPPLARCRPWAGPPVGSSMGARVPGSGGWRPARTQIESHPCSSTAVPPPPPPTGAGTGAGIGATTGGTGVVMAANGTVITTATGGRRWTGGVAGRGTGTGVQAAQPSSAAAPSHPPVRQHAAPQHARAHSHHSCLCPEAAPGPTARGRPLLACRRGSRRNPSPLRPAAPRRSSRSRSRSRGRDRSNGGRHRRRSSSRDRSRSRWGAPGRRAAAARPLQCDPPPQSSA
jgi:hypothetical protein